MKTSLGKSKIIGWLIPLLLVGGFYLARHWYFTPSANDGELAPDFTAQILDGSEVSLSDFRGQPVLLHFWGSWCGPCRRQHPELVKLVNERREEFKVLSIAIEQDEERWKRAIAKDRLNWVEHTMDATSSLRFLNGPISDLYGVNEVPTEFLLDADGHLVATNPTFAEIRQFLDNAR